MHKATVDMPELIRKFESLPPAQGSEWEESRNYFIEGLTGYLLSCRYYEKGLLEEDESAIRHAIGHMEESGKLLEKARKIVER